MLLHPIHNEDRRYRRQIRLSIEDQRRFVELLLNPPALSPAMKRAKAAHARLIRESP